MKSGGASYDRRPAQGRLMADQSPCAQQAYRTRGHIATLVSVFDLFEKRDVAAHPAQMNDAQIPGSGAPIPSRSRGDMAVKRDGNRERQGPMPKLAHFCTAFEMCRRSL